MKKGISVCIVKLSDEINTLLRSNFFIYMLEGK
jgi:hypothetical protein